MNIMCILSYRVSYLCYLINYAFMNSLLHEILILFSSTEHTGKVRILNLQETSNM